MMITLIKCIKSMKDFEAHTHTKIRTRRRTERERRRSESKASLVVDYRTVSSEHPLYSFASWDSSTTRREKGKAKERCGGCSSLGSESSPRALTTSRLAHFCSIRSFSLASHSCQSPRASSSSCARARSLRSSFRTGVWDRSIFWRALPFLDLSS